MRSGINGSRADCDESSNSLVELNAFSIENFSSLAKTISVDFHISIVMSVEGGG